MANIINHRGIFEVDGKPIRLKGFGLGSWLNLEHYMVGMPTPDSMIRTSFENVYGKLNAQKFWNNYIYSFIQEEDFKLIKESGANFLRVPFNYRLLIDDNQEGWKEEGFEYLRYLLDLCDKYKIYVLLDLHAAPGGQNPDWHSDNRTGIPQFWEFQVFRRQTTMLWGEIAKRFCDYEYLFGYDLLNEPAMCKWDVLNEFYKETIEEIRKYDKNHLIVLEGDRFAMDFTKLEKVKDTKVCLSFHFYPICWYEELSSPDCTRAQFNNLFRKVLETIVSQCKALEMPFFCGEFGFERDTTPRDLMYIRMEDNLAIFEEFDIDWVIWTYKDIGDMGLTELAEDSSWKKLTRKIEQEWNQDKEKAEAKELLALCKKMRYPMMNENKEYQLSFRMRANLFELQAAYIMEKELREIPWEKIKEYPSDFELKNCNIEERFLNIMKKITHTNLSV